MDCMIDTSRLWKGLVVISAIFVPITLVLFPYILESLKNLPKTIREMIEDLQNPQIAPFGLILKLAIVFLCVCMFVLFFYYAGLNSFAIKEKSVAATQANMFVVAATLFAPLAALIFVQDWKTQHNLQLFSQDAKSIWNLLKDERTYWREHYSILENIPENSMALNEISSFKELFKKSLEKSKEGNREVLKFQELTDDNTLKKLLLKKINAVDDYRKKYQEQVGIGYKATNSTFKNIQGIYLNDIAICIIDIEKYIRDKYILMK